MESRLICWLIVATFFTSSKIDPVNGAQLKFSHHPSRLKNEPSSLHELPVVRRAMRKPDDSFTTLLEDDPLDSNDSHVTHPFPTSLRSDLDIINDCCHSWSIIQSMSYYYFGSAYVDIKEESDKLDSSLAEPPIANGIQMRRICRINLSDSGGPGHLSENCFCVETQWTDYEPMRIYSGAHNCPIKETRFIFVRKSPMHPITTWHKLCFLNWSKHRTQSGSIPDIVCFCFGCDGIARADGGMNLFCPVIPQEKPRMNVYKATIQHSVDGTCLKKCWVSLPRDAAFPHVRGCFCETKDGKRFAEDVCEKFRWKEKEISSYLYFKTGIEI